MRAIVRLRALERAQRGHDSRRPTPEEMRGAALSGEGRPVVLSMLDRMRRFADSLDPWGGPVDANK